MSFVEKAAGCLARAAISKLPLFECKDDMCTLITNV
jgi:hypothetical protein